ncbi:hypothetical protein ACFPRL_34140 [Pseudoclavibacter helvolus]
MWSPAPRRRCGPCRLCRTGPGTPRCLRVRRFHPRLFLGLPRGMPHVQGLRQGSIRGSLQRFRDCRSARAHLLRRKQRLRASAGSSCGSRSHRSALDHTLQTSGTPEFHRTPTPLREPP